MKKFIFILWINFSINSTYAQKDLIERLEKQAIQIDSLTKLCNLETRNKEVYIKHNNKLIDSLNQLVLVSRKLEEIMGVKKKTDSFLVQKTDSIRVLKLAIEEKEKLIMTELVKFEKRELEKYETGKMVVIDTIAISYSGKNLDDILMITAGELTLRDLQMFHNQTEIKKNLFDVVRYYKAKDMLANKPDKMQVKLMEIELGQIKQKSKLVDRMKELISSYIIFNEGFTETLEKLRTLDNNESVAKLPAEVKKKKLDKILAELSSFIFNYDFNFSDYPYHTAIFLEVVRRKLPNPDTDIADLINKL